MAKKPYWEKLKDPRWQRKRLEVMEANDFSCEVCGDSESPLNVHHKEYFKDHEPWEYEKEQLAVLCENCHEVIHAFDFLKWVCSYARIDGPGSRDALAFLVGGFLKIPYHGLLSISGNDDAGYYRGIYQLGVEAEIGSWEIMKKIRESSSKENE